MAWRTVARTRARGSGSFRVYKDQLVGRVARFPREIEEGIDE
jgi:hypothetical protein